MKNEEIKKILYRGTYGVLSTCDAKLKPYGVPLNYFYLEEEEALYFHCAKKGKKMENLLANPQVSFTVIDREQIVEEFFTTSYCSVVVEGKASLVEEESQKRRLLNILCERLAPTAIQRREEVIEKYLPAVALVKIQMEAMSGKLHEAS